MPVAGDDDLSTARMNAISPAAALRARFDGVAPRLHREAPHEDPLLVDSEQSGGRLRADVHALVAHPFDAVDRAVGEPAHWCELLVLLPNIRRCRLLEGDRLEVAFARRFDQPLVDTRPITFEIGVDRQPQFVAAALSAARGPVGTSDYRIELEATAIDARQSYLHFRFSHAYGLGARLAAGSYFATSGRDKVGFTAVGTGSDGAPVLIGGLRGGVERNAMRYYLAIDALLSELHRPRGERLEASLRRWLRAIERYPQQLAEADPQAYFEAKREAPAVDPPR